MGTTQSGVGKRRTLARRVRRWGLAVLPLALGLSGCHAPDRLSSGLAPQFGPTEGQAAQAVRPNIITTSASAVSGPPTPGPPAAGSPAVPPVPVGAVRPITLDEALALGGANNPTIALAEEAVRAGEAERLQARVLLVPTLNGGVSFNLHRGEYISARGVIRDVDRETLYLGGGAVAVGAGTVGVPAVRVVGHLGDAIFAPRAAQQLVVSRQYDALGTRNNVLLDVALRYYDLAGAEASLLAIARTREDLAAVVKLTAEFARLGQGRQSDADRAASEDLLLQAQEQRAGEAVAVSAAELARLLDLDPSTRLAGGGEGLAPVRLVDSAVPLEEWVQTALRNRPELAARESDVALTQIRLRQEQVRPWLPQLSAGFSAGDFSGHSDTSADRLSHFSGRTDVDVLAVWTFQNIGLGNLARQRRQQALVGQALAQRTAAADQVMREVAEAQAELREAERVLETTRRQLRTARDGYEQDLRRARNIEGRPIEVLNSVNLLGVARQEHVAALVRYNQAQFRLFVASGQALSVGGNGPAVCR